MRNKGHSSGSQRNSIGLCRQNEPKNGASRRGSDCRDNECHGRRLPQTSQGTADKFLKYGRLPANAVGLHKPLQQYVTVAESTSTCSGIYQIIQIRSRLTSPSRRSSKACAWMTNNSDGDTSCDDS